MLQRTALAALVAVLVPHSPAALQAQPAPRPNADPSPAALVRVPLGALQPLQVAEIFSGRYDIAARFDGVLELVADGPDLARLTEAAVPHDIVVEDLTAFYAARLGAAAAIQGSAALGSNLVPPFGQGSMGGYYDLGQVESVLDQLAASYPTLITAKQSIGTTLEGRDIWAVKISDNPSIDENEPESRFDSMHHSREPQSMQSSLWFMLYLLENYGSDSLATYLVDERELWFIPVVNPDGYAYNQQIAPGGGGLWRKNRRNNGDGTMGVDLNRNYAFEWGFDDTGSSPFTDSETYRGPFPASEPEIQVMQAFLAQHNFSTALSVHSYSNLWLSPWGYDFVIPNNNADYLELGALATETSGYLVGPIAVTLYAANGGTVDYDEGVHGTMSFTPEIGGQADGFWPATDRIVPLAEETLLGFQRTALAAGAYVHAAGITPVDAGDGDGFFEAGELVEFDLVLRNSGRAATNGGVTVTLSTSSPWANVTGASHGAGAIASFSEANAQAAVALQIDAGAPGGTTVDWTLEVSYEGLTAGVDGEFNVGVPTRYLHDAVELDFGWTAGLPGDTASTGVWERADPIGTDSNGEPASPEDDASEAPGTLCFTTGNGGGSAGTDDVDDGITTLLSPVFDLSSVSAAEVRYSRWFADLSQADDTFEISISNDGGGAWTPLESVSTTVNEWTQVAFRVSDVLVPTDEMQLRFVASDDPNNSIVEAAIDELEVWIFDSAPRLGLYGSAELGTPIAFQVTGEASAFFNVYFSLGTSQIPIGGVAGDLLLDPLSLSFLYNGSLPADRALQSIFTVNAGPALLGATLYFQALVVESAGAVLTNRVEATIE